MDQDQVNQYVDDLDTAVNFRGGATAAHTQGRVQEAGMRALYGGLRDGFGQIDPKVQSLLDAAGDVNFRRGLTVKTRNAAMSGIASMLNAARPDVKLGLRGNPDDAPDVPEVDTDPMGLMAKAQRDRAAKWAKLTSGFTDHRNDSTVASRIIAQPWNMGITGSET